MEQWKEYKLEDLGNVVGGATPSTKDATHYDGDIPWITPKDLSNHNDRYIYRGERMITQKGFESCSCKMLPKGSVLFSSRAPIGYVAIAGTDMCTNQGFKSVVPNNEIVDTHFLYYLLLFNKAKIEGMGSGTTFKEVSGNVMKSVTVSIPNLTEQKRIADILSSLDDKIELNRRINDNLEQQAQALFDDMFFNNLELERYNLSNYADINPFRSIKKDTEVRFIEMSNLPTYGSFPLNWDYKHYNGGMKFSNGDTIMARITPCLENGKTAYIDFLDDNEVAFGSTEYIVFSARNGYCPALFYYLARNQEFIDYAISHMNGSSGRQRVSGNDIANFPMPHISKDSSDKFGIIVMPIMSIIRDNSIMNRALAQLRDTLLPRLMSGELKINDLNC